MWFFNKKKEKEKLLSDTWESMMQMIDMLRSDYLALQKEVDLINIKLRVKAIKKKIEEDEIEEDERPKDIYRGVLLPDR